MSDVQKKKQFDNQLKAKTNNKKELSTKSTLNKKLNKHKIKCP